MVLFGTLCHIVVQTGFLLVVHFVCCLSSLSSNSDVTEFLFIVRGAITQGCRPLCFSTGKVFLRVSSYSISRRHVRSTPYKIVWSGNPNSGTYNFEVWGESHYFCKIENTMHFTSTTGNNTHCRLIIIRILLRILIIIIIIIIAYHYNLIHSKYSTIIVVHFIISILFHAFTQHVVWSHHIHVPHQRQ